MSEGAIAAMLFALGIIGVAMGPLVVRAIVDSQNNMQESPAYGTRLVSCPYKSDDIDALLEEFEFLYAARYGIKREKIRAVYRSLRITFTSSPIIYGSKTLTGLTVDERDVRIFARRRNVRETALVHELIHVMAKAVNGDGDASHKSKPFHDGFEAMLWGAK